MHPTPLHRETWTGAPRPFVVATPPTASVLRLAKQATWTVLLVVATGCATAQLPVAKEPVAKPVSPVPVQAEGIVMAGWYDEGWKLAIDTDTEELVVSVTTDTWVELLSSPHARVFVTGKRIPPDGDWTDMTVQPLGHPRPPSNPVRSIR